MWADYLLYFIFVLFNLKNVIQVLAFVKNAFLFIASSFVWIHPIGHFGQNHYDLDVDCYSIFYVNSSSREFNALTTVPERPIIIRVPLNFNSTIHKANEQWHVVQDHLGRRHIGLVIEVVDSCGEILLCIDVLVSNATFFQFPIQRAKTYLLDLSEDEDDAVVLASELEHNLRIQGLSDLPDSVLVVKTFWIHIIQRRWKRVYKEKMRRLRLRGSLKSQRNFEISGKWDVSTDNQNHYMLRGMLSGL